MCLPSLFVFVFICAQWPKSLFHLNKIMSMSMCLCEVMEWTTFPYLRYKGYNSVLSKIVYSNSYCLNTDDNILLTKSLAKLMVSYAAVLTDTYDF